MSVPEGSREPRCLPTCAAHYACIGVHHQGNCACAACFRKLGYLVFHPFCPGFKRPATDPALLKFVRSPKTPQKPEPKRRSIPSRSRPIHLAWCEGT